MKRALVIFSGGQDSTTCLLWARQKYDEVNAITFFYGQRHTVEIECAKAICERLFVPQIIVDISFLNALVDSALLKAEGEFDFVAKTGLPASYVPNRNQLFITLAHAYAQRIGYDALVIGACEVDFSGYPDCRQVFISAIENTTNLGSNTDIRIEAPLMFSSKADIFAMAEKYKGLDIVVNMSHTCYNGNREILHPWGYGCGECPACKLREKGFNEYTAQKKV